MEHSEQVRLIKAVFDRIQTGVADMTEATAQVPVERYLSTTRLERERATLLRRWPVVVGFSDQIREPRQYLSVRAGEVPLIVLRDGQGVLRGFLNACRHRGTELLPEGAGRAAAISCPYHAWTYALDGTLASLPHAVGFPGLEKSSRGLIPVPVGEKHGLVFAVPTPGATLDLEAYLAGLPGELDGFRLGQHTLFRPERRERRLNWKLMLDGSFEGYHFRVTHKNTIAPLFFDNIGVWEYRSPHLRMVLPKQSILELRGTPEESWQLRPHANLLYFIFPNTIVLVQPDHAMVLTAWPLSVDDSVLVSGMLVPEAPTTEKATRHWEKNHQIFWEAIAEDVDMGERIQRSLRCGANDHLLFGRFETLATRVAASMDAAMDAQGDPLVVHS
jgi:phenylpropionate dioxygenase-like ring-hydroxylating dioxygenase large terminal subunit